MKDNKISQKYGSNNEICIGHIGRFMEQWILWMIINVFSITMWSLLLGTPEGSVTMIIMFSAYLINGVYGFRNWLKLSKVN